MKQKKTKNNDSLPKNQLIISHHKHQTSRQRYSQSLLTLFFWACWLYLWQPLVSLIAWLFGGKLFYDNMIDLGGLRGILDLLNSYVIVVCVMAIIFFGWAYYNHVRFRNKKRRSKTWKVSVDNLGHRFNLTEAQVLTCKTSRRFLVHFDGTGKITDVEKPSII